MHADMELRSLFDIPDDFKIVGSDLGKLHKAKYLRADGVIGAPDALFYSRKRKKWVVGEYKSRRYRGYIKRYEKYQVVLYLGLVRKLNRAQAIDGVLRFKDATVTVPFDENLYKNLIGMVNELKTARKNWIAPNRCPLHQRI